MKIKRSFICFLTLLAASPLHLTAGRTEMPQFKSGNGITVLKTAWMEDGRTAAVDIQTAKISENAINGGVHQVWITLPETYFSEPAAETRYPVLYLLHGGAGGWAGQWINGGGRADEYTKGLDLITVMPDGGKVGWFTNWVNSGSSAQQWESFHLDQLIPWIDANLRTNSAKQGRGIAGLSMGGFGAFHYAFRRPELFAYAGSFSGALDLQEQGTRLVIRFESHNNGFDQFGAFGLDDDYNWHVQNPLKNADKFNGTYLDMYAGSGMHDADVLERTMGWSSYQMHLALNEKNIPNSFWMYERPGGDTGCDGGHNFGCWNFALKTALPRMMAVFSGGTPETRSPDQGRMLKMLKPVAMPVAAEVPAAGSGDVDWNGTPLR